MLAQKWKDQLCNADLSLGTKFTKNISKLKLLLKKQNFVEIMSASWNPWLFGDFFRIVWKFDFLKTFLSVLHFSARLEYFFFIIHHFHVVSTIVAPTSKNVLSDLPSWFPRIDFSGVLKRAPQNIFSELKYFIKHVVS